jgi:hypothetical protein
MLKNLKYSGKLRWFLHEDFLDHEKSTECVAYSNSLKLYEKILADHLSIGHRRSFLQLFDQVSSEYVIHWEDDYELLKEIDLDFHINVMDKYPVNQICFPKRDILPDKPNFEKIEVKFDGEIYTTCNHWMVVPSIWRMSYVRHAINDLKSYNLEDFHWQINRKLKGQNRNHDAQFVIENTKTFYFGPIRGGKTVEHIGKLDRSVRAKSRAHAHF